MATSSGDGSTKTTMKAFVLHGPKRVALTRGAVADVAMETFGLTETFDIGQLINASGGASPYYDGPSAPI